jgi:hypothetical protein
LTFSVATMLFNSHLVKNMWHFQPHRERSPADS